jgi:hypothetical protein
VALPGLASRHKLCKLTSGHDLKSGDDLKNGLPKKAHG